MKKKLVTNIKKKSPLFISILYKNIFQNPKLDINCEKLITILKSLLKHEIRVLDFSHCKIGDRGATAIAKFSLEVPVEKVNLSNNKIGPKVAKSLSYALCQENCQITELDLHLNNIGNAGGNYLLEALGLDAKKSLNLSGCRFSENITIGRMFEFNSSLEILDISCNNISEVLKVPKAYRMHFAKKIAKLLTGPPP
ncbi:hypothetical protein NQ317_003786 [Molorchus minor]|uniref:Uncharacterized protein n=1 Tax=Molorchus minor TaxID=1323400 RepID=A0ABQ9JTW1_9CUCU|nr:hypothetical protein NQ317_003786 [Molorchus minor]